MTPSAARLLRRGAMRIAGAAGIALLLPAAAQAQFALAVSPPRFELSAQPGGRERAVIELTHGDATTGTYRLKTADWLLRADGSPEFEDELQPGSCRPWVAIERREIAVQPGRPYRFRFEVAPPAGTPPVECRFAIMIEGRQPTPAPGTPVALAARIGVIVYVAVGDAEPALELAGTSVQDLNGTPTPMLRIRNTGNAHGRLAGLLTTTDADGNRLELQPSALAILPGETRDVPLVANRPGDIDTLAAVHFPATIDGKLEWGRNGSLPVRQRFAP